MELIFVMSPKLFYFFSGFSAYDYGTAGIAGNQLFKI